MKTILKITIATIAAISLNSCATQNTSDPLNGAVQTGARLLALKNLGGALAR